MSRQREPKSPRRALLHKDQQQAAAPGAGGRPMGERGDEKTPLLNSMGAAAGSLMNSTVVGGGDIQAAGVSWRMAAFLLVNTALGAGMLNYPYAYNQIGGVWPAALMQAVLLVLITSTMFVLVYCADFNRDNTYHDVLLSMCGKRAQQISALSIMLTCYGINITFLVIIGDQFERLFDSLLEPQYVASSWWLGRKFTILLSASLFIWPMCYARRLDFLRHASVLGLFAMLYVAFLTVYEHYVLDAATIDALLARLQAPNPHTSTTTNNNATLVAQPPTITTASLGQQAGGQKAPVRWFEPMAVVPVLCFAYQTHEVIVPVYACMRERLIGSFMKASTFGLIILFLLYNLVGAFGYLTFGERVGADIMSLYDAQDPVVVVGVVALVIKFITTYPPLMFCGRSALDGLYAELRSLSPAEFKAREPARRYVISTLWFLSTVALAAFAPDISITLQLLGSMASINVFVFPGMCLVSLTRRLRRARLALLMGEPPEGEQQEEQEGFNGVGGRQQRAKDFYLISGSYFGAAMKKDAALRDHQQQQQQQQQLFSCPARLTGGAGCLACRAGPASPGQFTATFASLLEFESNLSTAASCNGDTRASSRQNLANGSSGRGTGETLSSSSISTASRSSLNLVTASEQQKLSNGYGTNGKANHERQLQEIGQQLQRRQDQFERMMTSSNSCCLANSSSNNSANYQQQQQLSSFSLSGPTACGTINHSYDDYSADCHAPDCAAASDFQHQQWRQQQPPLLVSRQQSSSQTRVASQAETNSAAAADDDSPLVADQDRAPALRSIRHNTCQHCRNHSNQLQQSLCLQNSLNYACQQSTTGSLLDKLGSSIAPATVAQVGISRCVAVSLHLFAAFLVLFGAFIFVLELVSVFGLL